MLRKIKSRDWQNIGYSNTTSSTVDKSRGKLQPLSVIRQNSRFCHTLIVHKSLNDRKLDLKKKRKIMHIIVEEKRWHQMKKTLEKFLNIKAHPIILTELILH